MDLVLVIGGQWEMQVLCLVLMSCNTSLSFSFLISFLTHCNLPFSKSVIILTSFSARNRAGLENANAFPSKNGLS